MREKREKKKENSPLIIGARAVLFLLFIIITSCGINTKKQAEMVESIQYTGWWVYGEGQHIFKDEESLGEWGLTFPNENMEELVELYLAVCEMEYFPMECIMQGNLQMPLCKLLILKLPIYKVVGSDYSL